MIRRADKKDLIEILKIKDEAVDLLKEKGVDQWQDGYPNEEVFLSDIENENLYVYDDKGIIKGFSAFIIGRDEAFESLEGSWKSETYLAIHRIAIGKDYRRQGIASDLFDYARGLARDYNLESVRIDTHEDNKSMQRLIEKMSYEHRGIISKGTRMERRAYELLI